MTLNFGGDGGGDIVVARSAAIDHEAAPADQAEDYRAKYDEHIARASA